MSLADATVVATQSGAPALQDLSACQIAAFLAGYRGHRYRGMPAAFAVDRPEAIKGSQNAMAGYKP
jgi:hypothetical protein